MKIGVSSYSFSRLVHSGAMRQDEVPATAREMGFEVIEFSTIAVPAGDTLPAFAAKLRTECEQVGLPIANYTIGADFLTGSGGDLEVEIARLKTEVEVAAILGVPGMRHDASRGFPAGTSGPRGFADALPRLARGCRAITEYAADRGIRTMVENHGFFCQDSERVEQLINAVNHANFGALVDICNFLCADEPPATAVARLLPYAFHVHAKDFHVKSGDAFPPGEGWFQSRAGNYLRGAIIGHGDVPLLHCLRLLKKFGYDGVLSIEFEGMEETLAGIRLGLANLRRLVDQVAKEA